MSRRMRGRLIIQIKGKGKSKKVYLSNDFVLLLSLCLLFIEYCY